MKDTVDEQVYRKFKVDEVEIGQSIYLDVLSNALDLEDYMLYLAHHK